MDVMRARRVCAVPRPCLGRTEASQPARERGGGGVALGAARGFDGSGFDARPILEGFVAVLGLKYRPVCDLLDAEGVEQVAMQIEHADVDR